MDHRKMREPMTEDTKTDTSQPSRKDVALELARRNFKKIADLQKGGVSHEAMRAIVEIDEVLDETKVTYQDRLKELQPKRQ